MFEGIKIRKAINAQQSGRTDEAAAIYEALYGEGKVFCSYMIPWSILLLRKGGAENYLKAKEILAKAQKAPDINEDYRSNLLLNYSVAQWKLGERQQAVELLEKLHKKHPSGNTYSALGYMYIDLGDAEKALAINTAGLEYDDEDAVVLDNMGQYYFRLANDPQAAKPYFEKAHQIKEKQIDTLWFLSRYDLMEGNTEAACEKLQSALEGRFSPLNYKTKAEIEEELHRIQQKEA